MKKMPVLFIGHGSPVNIILDNEYTKSLDALGRKIQRPEAIGIFTAHWQTAGTKIHCAPSAKQIYDFYGFQDELYQVKYEPKGAPEQATRASELTHAPCDSSWGNDHAAWSVLKHIFPKADVPVFYISSDMTAGYSSIYDMAKTLKPMREEGVLFIGSGNLVHNLRGADFYNMDAVPDERGVRFDNEITQAVLKNDVKTITDPSSLGDYVRYSIPTRDHYIPFVWSCALRDADDKVSFPYTGFQNSSVSMRSVMFGE